ncbi:hypothetical protein RFI_32928, partial [Reticulomyxa filosa]
ILHLITIDFLIVLQGGRSNKLMDDLKNKIIFYLHELQQSCQHLEFDIDHPDHLEQGRKIITYFEKLRNLESIIPEISNYRKEVAIQIEHAIRATLSKIENDYSLQKKNESYQREIKEQLVKLKVYAESLKHANAYLEQKGLKSAQDLELQITQKKAEQGDKRKLEQYQKIQGEYQQLQQSEKLSFETASKVLKSQGFTENEILRLISNESELIKKIEQCEQEINRCKNNVVDSNVLNVSRVEKVLAYLKECKSAVSFSVGTVMTSPRSEDGQNEEKKQDKNVNNTLKQEIVAIYYLMEDYLRHYAEFVQSQLRSLTFTETASSEFEKMQLMGKVETISNRVNEMMKLEKQHPIIFSYFQQDIMRQFTTKMEQIWFNLSDEMLKLSKHGNLAALKIKLFVANTLSPLDDYTKPNCKFRSLCTSYQEILLNNVIDTTKVRKAIEDHHYTKVAAEMSKLDQRRNDDIQVEKVFEEVQGDLSCSLKFLSKSTMNEVTILGENDVNYVNIVQLGEKLQWIDDAKCYVAKYVNEQTGQDIKKNENEIKSSLEEWISKIVGTTKAAINSYNFLEAEEKIEHVRRITRLLGSHFKQNHCNDNKEEITNRVNELETALKNELKSVVSKYKEIQLSGAQSNPYALNPPKDLYAKLNKVMQTATTYSYKSTWKEIEEDIIQKIREELLVARKKHNSDESDSCIRICELVANSLPEHMQAILNEEIKRCHEAIKSEIRESIKKVDAVLSKKNACEIVKLLDSCTGRQEDHIKAWVNNAAEEMVARIEKQWENGDTQKAVTEIGKLFRFKKMFKHKVPGLEKLFEVQHDALTNIFEKHHKHILDKLDFLNSGISALELIEQSLSFAIDCMDVKTRTNSDIDVKQLLPSKFAERMKEWNIEISKCFASLQQKYEHYVETMNAMKLYTLFEIIKTVGNEEGTFLQKVKIFFSKSIMHGFFDFTNTLFTYSGMVHDLNLYLDKMVEDITREGILNDKTKTNDAERDRFFQQLKEKLDFLKRLSEWKGYSDNKRKLDTCLESLEKEVKDTEKTKELVNWTPSYYDAINLRYNCLVFMSKHGIIPDRTKVQVQKIENDINCRKDLLKKAALNAENMKPQLLAMKEMSIRVLRFKDSLNKDIDEVLLAYKKKHKDGIGIAALAVELEKDPSGIGKTLVAEHSAFKGYLVSLFNVKTQGHQIEYTLKKIGTKGGEVNLELLRKIRDDFDKTYRRLVEDIMCQKSNTAVLISNTKLIIPDIEQNSDQITWNARVRNAVPDLIAHIFALWTLQNAQLYFDAKGVENRNAYLLQPHAAQVISIFRMLRVDENKPGLINNLVQIGTGQGKSITLAVTACVLALLGFDVSCASHSEYLSCRDFKSFESLFSDLGVIDHIHYSTFNKLCERIINDGGDVRKLVENMIIPDDEKNALKLHE